ncbi:MAG: ABC transporter ATP-binding protein [Chloroflexota bacterium]|nr:ABC transporter ATP-binding protein [Chloroflexota bacterium]
MGKSDKAIIRFNGVSKRFTLHHERSRSFQELALGLFRRNSSSPEHGRGRRDGEEFWALRGVSFIVKQGETVGLIGPNGAGKSTALKLISRIIEPTSGRIEVNGRVGALLELGAGFHPDLTGRENIFLNGSILGLSRADIRRKLDEIVAFAELERFIDVPVKHYSSGMYVRLGFSVAVHTDPEVLLVDEVLAVGDQNFQRKCMDRIYDMKQAGTTILLVSHGIDAVARLCHRAIWLDEGQVVDDGPARDMVEGYLVSVNEKERQRLEKAAARSLSRALSQEERIKRLGSGEIRIVDVAFLDAQGARTEVFLSEQAMTIRVTYEAVQRVEKPVFGISLYRNDNLLVAGPNTNLAGYHIPAAEGRGVLDFKIPHLPLMAGRYELSVSAYDETVTHKYAYLHRAFTFSIQPRSLWDSIGVMHFPGHWSHQTDTVVD